MHNRALSCASCSISSRRIPRTLYPVVHSREYVVCNYGFGMIAISVHQDLVVEMLTQAASTLVLLPEAVFVIAIFA